tara:strand:+ start:407 stop:820 length:414 start_codon:yes stop_codon:yes gene_type:complete
MTIGRAAGIENIKKMIDHFETLEKQELIQRLTLTNAQLLKCEKEIDRLNEYVQIMELEQNKILRKTVSQDSQAELEPIEDFLDQAEKEKKELEESYQESRRQTAERKEKERLTSPLDSFSDDLQKSINERKEKDGKG